MDAEPGVSSEPRTLAAYFAADPGPLPTEDVLYTMLPLMREVAALHERGLVADLGINAVTVNEQRQLGLAHPEGRAPQVNLVAVRRVQANAPSALKVVGEYRVVNEEGRGTRVQDLRASGDGAEAITKPIYLTDLRTWEDELGHHDEITDVLQIGLILASLACGLDPAEAEDVERFSLNRSNLFALNNRLHPVIATLIVEATALNRGERATDLAGLAQRLENYRDQPVGLEVERVLAGASGVPGRRVAVLSHLRDRLFDLSRRNRLVHFRSTLASVNLTEASVPIVARLESIRPDQLCTWGGTFVSTVLSGKAVPLNKWLRFEDQPHLPSAFDRMIQETRRDRAEYGFSNLRLVVAFLRWHNLKDSPNERIVSPLLWLPVEVSKAKGVRDQYVLSCPEPIAEFNPALRQMLRQLYDIVLPDQVDLTTTDIAALHADVMAQIHRTEPGVRLDLQEKPQIRMIFQKAVQRVNSFNRRRGQSRQKVVATADFSYERDDYRPLGFALFEKFVKPSRLPQRLAAGGSNRPSNAFMADPDGAQTFALGADEGHRYAWEVDLTQVTLANFNYKKMTLVRDYADLIEQRDEQPAFDQLFSIEPRPFIQDVPPPISADDQWGVVPADATQDAAVALARTGRSFIVQGPPGTGKSQTITNLIADYAARGKRVLFVCEKRAALDVVFHRLGQAGLAGLSCIIHDSQEDKKAFILDLKEQYERWGKGDDQLDHVRAVRKRTVAALSQHLEAIAAFDASVGAGLDMAGGQSLRTLVRRAAALPPVTAEFDARVRERLPDLATWDRHRAMIERVGRTVSELLGIDAIAVHPFARLNTATVTGERPYAAVESMASEAEALLDRLDRWIDGGSVVAGPSMRLDDARQVSSVAAAMQATGLSHTIALLDPTSASSLRLQQALGRITDLEAAADTAALAARHWREPLDPDDAAAALEQARRGERSIFRFFSGSWRKLKRTVAERYDFSAHAVTPSVTAVLEHLNAKHEADRALAQARREIGVEIGTTDLPALLTLRQRLSDSAAPDPVVARMLAAVRMAPDSERLIAAEAAAAEPVAALAASVGRVLAGTGEMTLEALAELLRDLREALDDLPDLLPLLGEIHRADPAVADALRGLPLRLPVLEALITDEAIARIERASPDIRRFDVERLMSLSRRAAAARTLMREQNSSVIRATLHRKFRDHVKQSEMSVTLLDTAGRAFKKMYATGRRELEHEFGKTMRYRSIRDLSDDETGAVVNDLKPIWLMSPLSVSDTLPLQNSLFDVVIFDEASQIPTEEAVPALSRSRQVIIVGDEMQLPPTSFFSTAFEEDDQQIMAEEDGQTIAILLDADSLLNQSARNLPATMLAWHYRSRSESLISFSNAAFYNGNLVTIPDRVPGQVSETAAPVGSSDRQAWADGTDRLLRLPITTHRIADGLYDRRINPPEARYISGLVRELLLRETGQSIGIVAFSQAQQGEIETALDALAAEDSAFATALEREISREDDDQFNGLFVKNLENVQGDERDIILMSVCYAPGRDGRMVMNFGPINQRGGEKRLNVIFSRARRHMAIVSTIAPEAITNIHNDGARALRSFLAFAEAQSSGAQDHAQAVLATLNPDAARTFGGAMPPDPVRGAIAKALRARGHRVDEHVGGASFRCDLAIAGAEDSGYRVGILLDRDADQAIGVEERFLFRPTILRAFGWRILDVPVAAWFRAQGAMIERIEAELNRDSWGLADADPFSGVVLPPELDAGLVPPAPPSVGNFADMEDDAADAAPPSAPASAEASGLIEFRLVQGTSNKFWRVGVTDCDLIVEFGRVGTKGQRVIKTFSSPERARSEEVKLTLEKTRKGYEEVS